MHVSSCGRQIPLSELSMDAIGGGLLSRSVQNLPLNEPVRAAERYREASTKQVRRAFAKWIRPSGFVQGHDGVEPSVGYSPAVNAVLSFAVCLALGTLEEM